MKGRLYTIGELSRISGLTVKAIRFYERLGLALPDRVDPATGYRYYSIGQFVLFDIIKSGRSIGMSPRAIKAVLDAKDDDRLLESLGRQEALAREKMAELGANIAAIEALKTAIAASRASASKRGLYYRDIGERSIVARDIPSDSGPEDILLAHAALETTLREGGFVGAYETGLLFEAAGQASEFRPARVFSVVATASGRKPPMVATIGPGRFLCVNYGEGDALPQQSKLNARLKRGKLSPRLLLQVDLLSGLFSPGTARVELQALV
jgi:DNA-binding transcriptional MerR regulator